MELKQQPNQQLPEVLPMVLHLEVALCLEQLLQLEEEVLSQVDLAEEPQKLVVLEVALEASLSGKPLPLVVLEVPQLLVGFLVHLQQPPLMTHTTSQLT